MHIPNELQTAVEQLAFAIRQSKPGDAFAEAKQSLDQDNELQAILKRLAALQSEVRTARDTVSQAQLSELRSLQTQVQSSEKVVAFIEAQQVARWHLDQLVDTFSLELGADFTALSANTSCCG